MLLLNLQVFHLNGISFRVIKNKTNKKKVLTFNSLVHLRLLHGPVTRGHTFLMTSCSRGQIPQQLTEKKARSLRLEKTWNSCTILFTDKTGYWWGSSALESVWVFDNKLLVRSLAISGFLRRREGSGVRRSAGYLFWLDAGDVLKAREAALWRWQESNNCLSPRDTTARCYSCSIKY